MDCGSEKVAVFEGSDSPDGRYAFGWTIRAARNQAPANWTAYDPEKPSDWLQAYLPADFDAPDPAYRLVNGVLDLHAHRFTTLAGRFPYWPNKHPAGKSVRRFLRQQWPRKDDSFAVTYGGVSFAHGAALIDCSADIPKSENNSGAEGTVRVTLPAGTINGVKGR